MNVKSILFPTDFSHYNDAALKLASTLAAEAGAVLHIVHVHDVRDLNAVMGEGSYLYASTTWDTQQHEAEERLKQIEPTVPGVKFEHECLTGIPEREILDFAETNDVDMIVMASHGRTGLSRLLMGSIAEAVMRKARCPVLIVKQPVEENSPGESEPRLLAMR
jgi:nucleotide-binding universal stress UspA family protein